MLGILLEITLRWLKGGGDIYKQGSPRGIRFTAYPPKHRENLIGDPTWIVTLLAIERCLFGDPEDTLFDDLAHSRSFELRQAAGEPDQLVFRGDNIRGGMVHAGISRGEVGPLY
jgi:hypothetical protein